MSSRSRVFIIVVLFLLCLPSLLAIGLSGRPLGTIAFQPGKTITNHYTVLGVSGPVALAVDSGPFSNISVSELMDNEFDLSINFPQNERVPTGQYSFALSVRELVGGATEGIGSLTAVSKVFQVEVYSYEKEIAAELIAPSVNEGTPINFKVSVESRSYQDIDAISSEITVFDKENHSIGKLTIDEQPLPSLSSIMLRAPPFPTTGLEANEYQARAVVFYDGKELHLNGTFKIGAIDIALLNYSQVLEQGFNEFFIEVESRWGDVLKNVYAKVFLNDEEILQTPSFSLNPWEKGVLKSIAKVDLLPGSYVGKIQLFFEGEMKEVPITVLVQEATAPERPKFPVLLITTLVLSALLVIVLVIFILQMKRRNERAITAPEKNKKEAK
ncbi:MAG: hypothetical protein Q8R53_04890 [Nanoarchaeota archaeon]|nr:hypothetical protein [Nanoarchaeota archaeon]